MHYGYEKERGGVLVLVPLKVFRLKRSSAEALAVPLRVLGPKIMTGDM